MLRDLNAECVLGTHRVGVPASSVPATGTHGPAYLYPWVQAHPEHAEALVRGRIIAWPAAGVLVAEEDTRFVYTPSGDGVFSFSYQPEVDGVAMGPAVAVALNSGSDVWTGLLGMSPTLARVQVGSLLLDHAPPTETYGCSFVAVQIPMEVGVMEWNVVEQVPHGEGLVSLLQARAHLRSDETADDADLELKIMAASAVVADYLGDQVLAFANALGERTPGATVPARVQMATLLMVGHLYRERDGGWAHGAVPPCEAGYALVPAALALLCTLRKPVVA